MIHGVVVPGEVVAGGAASNVGPGAGVEVPQQDVLGVHGDQLQLLAVVGIVGGQPDTSIRGEICCKVVLCYTRKAESAHRKLQTVR